MTGPGFVTSWLPQRSHSHQFPSRDSTTPLFRPTRMMLVSHEKLEVFSNSDDVEAAKYRLELQIPASISKAKRRECIASLKKHANYPGFRKGSIPPFVMKAVPVFVLKDSAEEILQEALKELELRPLQENEDESPDLDYDELNKSFTVGQDFTFSLELPLRKFIGELTDEVGDEIVDVESHGQVDLVDDPAEQR